MSVLHEDALVPKERIALALGNIYEFNERHNAHLSISELINRRMRKSNFAVSAEMALFWGGTADRRIVVLPAAPSQPFVDELSERLSISISCVVPSCVTGWVCRDLLADHNALDRLLNEIGRSEVVVIPWGATTYVYQLMSALTERGVNIVGYICPPQESHKIADYIDSKVGGRSILDQVASHYPHMAVPPGFICVNRHDAAEVAYALSRHAKRPLVLKSDRGAGGRGIRMFLQSATPDGASYTSADYLDAMLDDEYWKDVPVVVEAAIGGGTELILPTFEGVVGSDGLVLSKGTGNCLIQSYQYYIGIEMGREALPSNIASRIEDIGQAIGEKIAGLGYSGWYDVDFLAPTFGDMLYGSEINARLTGPVFAMEAMSRMFGHAWRDDRYVRVHERLWLKEPLRNYDELSAILSAIQASTEDGCGVLPVFTSAISLAEPYLGYMIYASSREHAADIEAELRRHLRTIPLHTGALRGQHSLSQAT